MPSNIKQYYEGMCWNLIIKQNIESILNLWMHCLSQYAAIHIQLQMRGYHWLELLNCCGAKSANTRDQEMQFLSWINRDYIGYFFKYTIQHLLCKMNPSISAIIHLSILERFRFRKKTMVFGLNRTHRPGGEFVAEQPVAEPMIVLYLLQENKN